MKMTREQLYILNNQERKTDPRIRVAAYADDFKSYAVYDCNEQEEIQGELRLSIQETLRWAKNGG